MVENGRRRPVTVERNEDDVYVDDAIDDSSAVIDEYNAQPDSGSVIGGTRGEQEYGIDSHVSRETTRDGDPLREEETTATERGNIIDQGGVSEWSMDQSNGEEEQDAAYAERRELLGKRRNRGDGALENAIRRHLCSHPELDGETVEVKVENSAVKLSGQVGSDRAKLLVEQIVESIPGHTEIENNLIVDASKPGNRLA